AGSTFAVNLKVLDVFGNTATGYSGTHTITWSGGGTSPGGNAPTYPTTAVSFTNGVSTTALNATLYGAGSNTLSASATAPTASGTSGTITVTAAGGSRLAWTSATLTPSATLSGTCYFTCTYTAVSSGSVFTSRISLTDAYGNLANATTTFTVT